jgi:phage major head subunit gpT-like protein
MGKLVDSTLLTEARTTFNMAFRDGYRSEDPIEATVMALLAGAKKTSGGERTKYPIMGQLTGLREWIGPRQAEDLARYAYELKNRTFEKTLEVPVNDFEDDQYEGYADLATEFGRQAMRWPADLVLAALQAGTSQLCFDGQFFFDTDHPVDPANAASAVYANLFTATALSTVNFSTTLATLQRIPGRDGRPLGVFGGDVILLVPPQLREVAKQIVEAEYLANGASNVNRGAARAVVWPRLGNEGTVWYLVDASPRPRPMIFQERQAPTDVVTLMGQTDPNVFEFDAYKWGVKARGAAGYGLPFTIARCAA